MIKTTLLITFILASIFQSVAQDLKKYQKAHEYILSDSTMLNESFKDYLQNWNHDEICISPIIQYIGILPLINKIVDYEYSPISYIAKKNIIDCLLSNDVDDFVPYTIDSLQYSNSTNLSCKLKLFNSNIVDNKLLCKVVLCNDCSDNLNESSKKSLVFLMYIIYFENDDIVKVLNTIGYQ
jgi:hypothetical protein